MGIIKVSACIANKQVLKTPKKNYTQSDKIHQKCQCNCKNTKNNIHGLFVLTSLDEDIMDLVYKELQDSRHKSSIKETK
jgi:hypothetical protein